MLRADRPRQLEAAREHFAVPPSSESGYAAAVSCDRVPAFDGWLRRRCSSARVSPGSVARGVTNSPASQPCTHASGKFPVF